MPNSRAALHKIQRAENMQCPGAPKQRTLLGVLAYVLALSLPQSPVRAVDTAPVGIFEANHAQAVPSFIVIGTAKGGTTDLFEQLVKDAVNTPGLRPGPPITHRLLRKEVGGLHSPSLHELLLGQNRFRSYLAGLGHPCANETAEAIRACIQAASERELTIDATPDYMEYPQVPLMLAAFSPYSKIIAMLREPVDRVQSLYNHFFVEEGRWNNTRLDVLVDEFFNYVNSTSGISSTLQRLKSCRTAVCRAEGWQDLVGLGIMQKREIKLFAGGLYRYILAPWRLHCFRPNRVMIIDSHLYFRNRLSVMEQVVHFLYGRNLTDVERNLAAHGLAVNVKRHNTSVPHTDRGTIGVPRTLAEGPSWMLSAQHLKRLSAFYHEHTMGGLVAEVDELRGQGAWVVGFDNVPWIGQAETRRTLLQRTTRQGG